MIDGDLQPGENARADVWWVCIKNLYLVLGKVALTILLLFHGLQVVSSFSIMGNKKSGQSNTVQSLQ